MSESQRLISKYITRLSLPISTLYQIHLLQRQNDESAIIMLKDELGKVLYETENQSLRKILYDFYHNIPISSRLGEHHRAEKHILAVQVNCFDELSDKEPIQKAFSLFKTLHLEDALQYFKLAQEMGKSRNNPVPVDKFYRERWEANFVLGNCHKALKLAEKAKFMDMAFVSAISVGNFQLAKKFIPSLVNRITTNHQDKKNIIVTTYELIHLIIYVLFAVSTSAETQEISNRLFNSTFLELPQLKHLTELFCSCHYSSFLKLIPDLIQMLNYSIYSSPSSSEFISAIKQNVIALHLFPLASANLESIAQLFNISLKDIIDFTKKSIRERNLNGKLDLVKMIYCGSQRQNDNLQLADDIYEKTVGFHTKLEVSIWIDEYNKLPRTDLQ